MNRIDTICSLIPQCTVIADIGCDHGKVSEHIVTHGLARNLIVNDISEPCLQKAKDRLAALENDGRVQVEFWCCDGAELAERRDIGYDCVVIAGMGGREILKILAGVCPTVAIVAPQNYTAGVRQGICKLNYAADADILVRENDKFYDILRLRWTGTTSPPSEVAQAYGHNYRQKNPDLLARLLRDKQQIASYKATPANQKKLQIIEEVLQWQR